MKVIWNFSGGMASLTDLLKRMAVCFSKSKTDLGMTYPRGDADRSNVSTVKYYSIVESPAVSGGWRSKTKLSKLFLLER